MLHLWKFVLFCGLLMGTSAVPISRLSDKLDKVASDVHKPRASRDLIFVLGKQKVIRGWEEGVTQMSVGQKAKLTISPDYTYGATGHPRVIPLSATLDFYLELLKLE